MFSQKKKSGGVWDTLKTVIYAVVIALGVRTVAFEPFNIPTGSMIPSLLIGDYLFVSKYSYGYSDHSLPFSLPLVPGERILADTPERGDIAVFKLPADQRTDYIKRVIGLPGDLIQVVDGVLRINGQSVERERIQDFVHRDGRGNVTRFRQYLETLPDGATHRIIEQSDTAFMDNTPVYRVPDGHYFMMGDNRDNSKDSRFLRDVGYVPFENFVGRAEVIFFSTDGTARLWELWRWPFAIRFDRLFDSVG